MAQPTVSNRNDEKQRALSLALGQIEKQYGKGAIMRLGESQTADIPVIPTGSLALDAALGVGGVPRGRITRLVMMQATERSSAILSAVSRWDSALWLSSRLALKDIFGSRQITAA